VLHCEWYRDKEEATTPSNLGEEAFSDNKHRFNGAAKDSKGESLCGSGAGFPATSAGSES